MQNNKKDAEDALKKIPEIQNYIDEAEQKTQEARDNLRNAEYDAGAAKEIAETAKRTAEKAYLVCLLPSDFNELSSEKRIWCNLIWKI